MGLARPLAALLVAAAAIACAASQECPATEDAEDACLLQVPRVVQPGHAAAGGDEVDAQAAGADEFGARAVGNAISVLAAMLRGGVGSTCQPCGGPGSSCIIRNGKCSAERCNGGPSEWTCTDTQCCKHASAAPQVPHVVQPGHAAAGGDEVDAQVGAQSSCQSCTTNFECGPHLCENGCCKLGRAEGKDEVDA